MARLCAKNTARLLVRAVFFYRLPLKKREGRPLSFFQTLCSQNIVFPFEAV